MARYAYLTGSKISRKILALSLRILGKSKKRQLKRRWVLRTTRQEVVLLAAEIQPEAARRGVVTPEEVKAVVLAEAEGAHRTEKESRLEAVHSQCSKLPAL